MGETEKYPIDFDAIQKGDVIPRSRLIEIIGELEPHLFQAQLVKMADAIQKHLWGMGRPWTVCIAKGEIVILTDADATTYNARWFRRHKRALVQVHLQMLAVDGSKLGPEERRQHDRVAAIQGITIAALQAARRAIPPAPVEQERPRLPGAG